MTPESQIKRYTIPEFASRIRAKYPDQYKDLSDDDLTMRVLRKHPEYKSHVNLGTEQDALAAVNQAKQRVDQAQQNLMSAAGKNLNPTVTPGSDYFRSLTATEQAAQKRGEPVIISEAGQPKTYDTQLSPAEESSFQQWKKRFAPRDSGADYDLRGAYKAGLRPNPKTGHWPDTFKKPNHPTFSNQSQYAVGEDAAKAGRWEGETFTPPSAQPGPAASQMAPSTSLASQPPVSLGPVIQSHLEQIQRQQRQRELQAKVEQARQVRQRVPKGMLLAPGQQNQPNYQPKFGGGQPYREMPKVDLSVGNTAELLAPTTKPGTTFEQDRATRAAVKEAKRPLQGIGDLRRYDEQQTKAEARIKGQVRAQVLQEEAEREAAAASGTEAQLLAQRARQEGMNPPDIEGQVEERYQSYLRSVAPEMVEQRRVFGELSPTVRAVAAPVARSIGGLMKTAGGIAGLGGLTENDFSRWANTRGAFVEESASLAPLNEQGEAIIRGLPEQAVAAATDLGLSISQLVLLKKATGLPLGRLMALETVLKTTDAPLKDRAKQVARSYAMGSVLDQHLGRLASATLFGAQPGLQNLAAYKEGNITLEDALLQTGIQAGAGFILGGKGAKQLPKEAIDYTLKSPLTPEPVKDVVADVMKYGKGLVRSEDGRNLSLYADPQTGNIIGSEITAEQAKKYDPTIVTGEKRPVRSAKEISAEEYDALAQTLGIETKTRPKQLPGEVERPEPKVEKVVAETKAPVSETISPVRETRRPKSETIVPIPETAAKTQNIIPELSRVESIKAETEVIPRPIVPAVEPAVTPPAEVKTQPTATESQLTTEREALDVTQEAAVVPSQSGTQEAAQPYIGTVINGEVRGQANPERMGEHLETGMRSRDRWRYEPTTKTVYWTADEVPTNDLRFTVENWLERRGAEVTTHRRIVDYDRPAIMRTLTDPASPPRLEAEPAQPVSPKEATKPPLQLNKNLADWAARLKTIAEAKSLDDLQALSDEMAAHKDDPRVARLRTSIQEQIARARQPEIPESPTGSNKITNERTKLSKASKITLEQAESAEGKTIRPAPTHRIGAPKLDTQRNSLEQQVRAYGGVKDDADQAYKGELKWLSESGKRGTVNQTGGTTAEKLATSLAQDGYGKGVWWEDNPNNVDPQKFLQAVMDDTRGQKHYSTERDAIEDDPDVKAWDTLTETDTGKELIERVQSGHARAADIVQFVREAGAHGLSDNAIDAFVAGLHRTVQEELSGGTEEAEGYSLDEAGTLLDPDGTPLFAREFQLGLPAEGLTQQAAPKPKTTDQREALIRAQQERDEAADPERAAALRKLEEIRRRGMTVDEYARQGSMFEAAPSKDEIKLLKDLERKQLPPESGQSSMFAAGRREAGEGPISVEGNRINLGEKGAEALSKAYRKLDFLTRRQSVGGAVDRNPQRLAKTLDGLGETELAKAVREAATDNPQEVVLYSSESERRHELFHVASGKAGETLRSRHSDLNSLTDNDTFDKIYRRLTEMGYPGRDIPTLVEEAAAHIAEGRYEQLGITREEAVEWMYKWFKSFEAKNPRVNPRQFQEMSDEATKARDEVYAQSAQSESLNDEAVSSVQAGREGGDRGSIAAARESDITQTETFRNWFKESKVVDENGNPLVVYHTTTKDFTEFREQTEARHDAGFYGTGFYFTPEPGMAEFYVEGQTQKREKQVVKGLPRGTQMMPVYLSVQNPYHMGPTEAMELEDNFEEEGADFTTRIKERGYDGIFVHRYDQTDPDPDEIVVFKPTQIKSATGNRGSFDPSDPNILMARSEKGETPIIGIVDSNGSVYSQEDPSLDEQHDQLFYQLRTSLAHFDKWHYLPSTDTVYWSADSLPDSEAQHAVDNWLARQGFTPQSHKLLYNMMTDYEEQRARAGRFKSEPLFARSDDPWADLSDLADEFERIAKEPEPGEKKTKQSKLAAGVEAKAIEAKLTAGFQGLPEYETVKVADQARMASELLRNDPQEARKVAIGQSIPPDNLLPESVFVAVENDALQRGDVDLLRELATASSLSLEATGMGQRIRLLAERNPYSPVTAMKEVAKARETRAKKKMGPKFRERVVTEIKAEVRKKSPKAKDWRSFLEEIKCR